MGEASGSAAGTLDWQGTEVLSESRGRPVGGVTSCLFREIHSFASGVSTHQSSHYPHPCPGRETMPQPPPTLVFASSTNMWGCGRGHLRVGQRPGPRGQSPSYPSGAGSRSNAVDSGSGQCCSQEELVCESPPKWTCPSRAAPGGPVSMFRVNHLARGSYEARPGLRV